MIPYGRQLISDEDISAVVEVLRSDFLTQGKEVPLFEAAIANYCGVPYAVAVNSATSALHISCLALGVGPGDRVWTSPNTFVASANCARYCGASVDFVDIDPHTLNISVDALAGKLAEAERTNSLPKVVIPVHFAGLPCDLEGIARLARKYGFRVIEDASHAVGARLGGHVVGDCAYSDITVFSFHPVKIITTAEGGVATSRSPEIVRRLQLLRSHGITRSLEDLQRKDEGPWYYEQHCLGFNYRMTDLQAALGVSQLARLDTWVERRHVLAGVYNRELADLSLILPVMPEGSRSALHLYVVQIDTASCRIPRRVVFERLRAAGIGVNVHYIPVNLQPDYAGLGFGPGQFPNAENYYSRCMSLPMFAGLSDADQQIVVSELRKALS